MNRPRYVCAALGTLLLLTMSGGYAQETKKSQDKLQKQLEAAQERLDEAAREVAELSMSISGDAMPHVMPFLGGSRAMLGINIEGDSSGDGVKVMSVSPGGPAEKAGIKAGDVLVQIDDEALKADDGRRARAKLMSHMREIDPGQKVKVQYRRGGKLVTTEVEAQPVDRVAFAGVPMPPPPPARLRQFHGPELGFRVGSGAFGRVELAPLTPQLGRYFGTEEGLLVVRAPRDERLKLEDGDVILDIDGRKPTSPAHAMRILGSYQKGESVKVNVLRMKKKTTLTIDIPERGGHRSALEFELPPEDVLMPAWEEPLPPEEPLSPPT